MYIIYIHPLNHHHHHRTCLVEEHQVHHGVPLVVLGQLGVQHALERPQPRDGQVRAAAVCVMSCWSVSVKIFFAYPPSIMHKYTCITRQASHHQPPYLLLLPPAAPVAGVVPEVVEGEGDGATKRVKMRGGASICFCAELGFVCMRVWMQVV